MNPLSIDDTLADHHYYSSEPSDLLAGGQLMNVFSTPLTSPTPKQHTFASIASAKAPPPPPNTTTTVSISTKMLPKYWRNDRKNIQGFPTLPGGGDYTTELEKVDVRAPVVPVRVRVTSPGACLGLRVVGAIRPEVAPSTLKGMCDASGLISDAQLATVLYVASAPATASGGGRNFDFAPSGPWKFPFPLPKKKAKLEKELIKYQFEVGVFKRVSGGAWQLVAGTASMPFGMGSTRTLLRMRRRGDSCASSSSSSSGVSTPRLSKKRRSDSETAAALTEAKLNQPALKRGRSESEAAAKGLDTLNLNVNVVDAVKKRWMASSSSSTAPTSPQLPVCVKF